MSSAGRRRLLHPPGAARLPGRRRLRALGPPARGAAVCGPGRRLRALCGGARLSPKRVYFRPDDLPSALQPVLRLLDPVVASALEALVGGEPAGEAVESALATIPAGELDAALPVARSGAPRGGAAHPASLSGRPSGARHRGRARARHASSPRGGPGPRGRRGPGGDEGGADRRAARPLPAAPGGSGSPGRISPPPPQRIALGDAWASAVDGTGGRGLWLTLAGPYGERTLLAAVLSDELGLLDFSTGAMPKRRIDEQLRAVQAESPLPWVAVPASWAWATLVAAAERTRATDRPVPPELGTWIERLGTPAAEPAPVYARLPAEAAAEPALLESPRRSSRCPSWRAGSSIRRGSRARRSSGSRRRRVGSS